MTHRTFVFTTILAVSSLLAPTAEAQAPRGGYTPRRPTVSPYLDLFRTDSGALPNYHTFVRPKQQLQRYERNQAQAMSQLRQGLQGLQQQQQGFMAQGVRATGNAGGAYMNYLHFYPNASRARF